MFRYSAEYLSSPGARALSLSRPLRESHYSQAVSLPFFAGLLPDGDLRRRIADYLHVSESSTLKLLDALGGECAGTVSLLRDGADGEPGSVEAASSSSREGYKEVSQDELAALIRDSERRPLLAPRSRGE